MKGEPNMEFSEFTDKLDKLMEERKLNKSTLSKACGIPYTTIDGWYKKGCTDLKVSTLKKLTEYFGLSLDYWLKDDAATEKAPAPEGTEAVSMEQSNRLYDALVAAGLIVDDDLAAQDFQFLGHICDLITDWFSSKHPE